MNTKQQKNSKILEMLIPNYISIIWFLMCLKNALVRTFLSLNMIDYLIWLIVVVYFVLNNNLRRMLKKRYYLLKDFFLLASIQILGLGQNCTVFSVRNIISTLCVAFFLNNAIFYKGKIQIHYIRMFYYLSIFFIIYGSMKGIKLDNTGSGVLAFMLFGYIFMEVQKNIYYKHINLMKFIKEWGMVSVAVIASLIATYIAAARTALFTILIMILMFVIFSICKISVRCAHGFFYILVAGVITGIIVYMNISNASWYNRLNVYSLQYFGKNINSSRPYLWKYSLDSLNIWQSIIGRGTGTLPGIARYATSSFHNSYIQIIMQNGLIGLVILIVILKKVWYSISKISGIFVGRILLAFMVGVIVYNCLESTLIQNKVFLGCTQWLILGMGIRTSMEYK